MRKDIKNVGPVVPIVRKPRITNHKTFGEGVLHGDFTFNNKDYANAKWYVKVFGTSKFIKVFWQILIPTIIWGVLLSLLPTLFTILTQIFYPKGGIAFSIFQTFSFTMERFGYINVIVATAWVLIGNPVVGNYIGRNQPQKIREVTRFIFYMILVTSIIAIVCEYIYAPLIAEQVIFTGKLKGLETYEELNSQIANGYVFNNEADAKNFIISIETYAKYHFSIVVIKYFAFSSFIIGVSSLYTPMFASLKKNKVLIWSSIISIVLFLIIYPSYLAGSFIKSDLYLTQYDIVNVTTSQSHYQSLLSLSGVYSFLPLINVSCGLYLFYYITMIVCMFIYTLFPKYFKKLGFNISVWFKNIYNSLVDKQSRIEYRILKQKAKKNRIQNKIDFYKNKIQNCLNSQQNSMLNGILDESKIDILNAHNKKQADKYQTILNKKMTKWSILLSDIDNRINDLQTQYNNTPSNTRKLFYIDYDPFLTWTDYEKYFLWFSGSDIPLKLTRFKSFLIVKLNINLWKNRTHQFFSFRVSKECMKNVWKVSGGIFFNQFCYGIFGLSTIVLAQSFNGHMFGIQEISSTETNKYYGMIVANASEISSSLGIIYGGFALIPQYFVSYYLGRNDKETAYHNSMLLMNWSLIVGMLMCCVALVYAAFLNANTHPTAIDGMINIPTSKNAHIGIPLSEFYKDVLYMEVILALVELFDANTTISYYIFNAGGSKWSFFCDQLFRIVFVIVLAVLNGGHTKAVQWFDNNYQYNLFIYYLISRLHSVVPAIISWIFIERGLALRVVDKNVAEEIAPNILNRKRLLIAVNNKLDKKSKIVVA